MEYIKAWAKSAIFITIALIAGIITGILQIKPPMADENSPEFQRMMYNIERWSQRPRYSGSAEIQRVRAEIIEEIEAMGLVPTLQDVSYTRAEATAAVGRLHRTQGFFIALPNRPFVLGRGTLQLQNIFVRLEAPNTDRTIMFVTHYDSAMRSPGAADAMLPVCAMLEAMRMLADNSTLQNNIYFLFTDGEEMGALGALAFVQAHPELRERVDMVINLEARGTRGGLILAETSQEATVMLNVFRRAAPKPMGFSAGDLIYAVLPALTGAPVFTDFCFFLEYGWRGINLAIVEGVEHYHQPTDTIENLGRPTAQHYLETVLALANYVAANPLDELRQPSSRAVFFPFLPGNMVVLSFKAAYILCAFSVALAIALLAYQIKRGLFKISFSTVVIPLLVLLSLGASVYFHAASYLLWLPLFAVVFTTAFKKWPIAFQISRAASIIAILLLWVPLVYLIAGLF